MSFYGEPPYGEEMCLECVEKKEKEVAKRNAIKLKIKNFAKDHWKFWITVSISIVAIIVRAFETIVVINRRNFTREKPDIDFTESKSINR